MIRRLLYGRKVYECGACAAQFNTQDDYESHWWMLHRDEWAGVTMEIVPGCWVPAIPLPLFVRQRKQADW